MTRINSLFATLAVAGIGMTFSGIAQAQTAPAPAQAPTVANVPLAKVAKPFRVKLGAFLPSNGDVKDAVGSTLFGYGVSYDFLKTNLNNPVTIGAYIDGATGSKSHDGIKARLSYIGVGPMARYYFTPVVAPIRFYGGAGLGAYFVNAKAGGDSRNKTELGGKLLAGVESGQGIFGELDYTFISKFDDVKPSGINLAVGYRF